MSTIVTYKTTSRQHAWAQFKDDERELWQKCDGCGLMTQSARDVLGRQLRSSSTVMAGGIVKAWRIKVGEMVFWSDFVPTCGAGPDWEVKALPAGAIAEQLEARADHSRQPEQIETGD